MNKFVSITLLFLGLLASTGAQAQVVLTKPNRPASVMAQPAKARKGLTWIAGHWKWQERKASYTWVEGHWTKAPKGKTFVSGHWKKVKGGWKWVPGHWKR